MVSFKIVPKITLPQQMTRNIANRGKACPLCHFTPTGSRIRAGDVVGKSLEAIEAFVLGLPELRDVTISHFGEKLLARVGGELSWVLPGVRVDEGGETMGGGRINLMDIAGNASRWSRNEQGYLGTMSQTNQIELARAMSGVLERRVSLLESKDLLEVVRIEGFSKAMRANGIKVCFSADDNRCLSLNDSRRISLATDSSDKDVWDSFGAVFHIRTSFAELAEEFQDSVPEERLSLYSRWDRQFRGMQDQASFFLALDQETRVWMLDAPGILRPTGYFHAFDVKGWEKLLLEVIDDERMPSFLSSLPLFEFGRIEQHFFESLAGVKYLGLQEKVTRAIQKIENSYIRAKFTELVQEYWAM